MSTAELPPIDLDDGLSLIKEIPLGSPFTADEHLGGLLDRLLTSTPAPDTLITLLEALRLPLHRVLDQLADEYRSKLLPLDVDDRATFLRVNYRWQQMGRSYTLAASLLHPGPADLQATKQQAMLLQRALHYIGHELFEHYVARQEVAPGLWHKLHAAYAEAERLGQEHTPVDDVHESREHQTHCTATYIASLLLEMASPYGLTLRQLDTIRRWAMDWAPLVSLQALEDDLELPPYVIRLDEDRPLHLFNDHDVPPQQIRHLDCSRLGLHLNHLLTQLQTRISPAQLGLGDEPAYLVRPLLARLVRPWTLAASPRRFRRFDSTGKARATTGFHAMHFAVFGRHFIQPDPSLGYSREAAEGLYTFGQLEGRATVAGDYGHTHYEFDEWQVLNHSANGFRLARGGEGQRVTLGQSIAVCPHDGENFLLCRINWLMEERDGSLVIGVSVLGGLPQAIAVRTAKTHDRYDRAFLLPASPVTEESTSLMLPPGIYVPKGELEVLEDGQTRVIRMQHVIERGSDFDRVTFDAL